nr:hypothetical protein BaRGS_016069 [Batillaria attramentaria]
MEEGHPKILELLLQHGADANVSYGHGRTMLSFAAGCDKDEEVALLLQYGAKADCKNLLAAETPLHNASLSKEKGANIARMLIEHGADVHARTDVMLITPLHRACESGNVEVARVLLENGASLSEGNMIGDTALIVACVSGSVEMVRFLLERGADVNEKNNYNQTALHKVASSGDEEVAKILLQKGARPDEKDESGEKRR